jgi:hypothetical protein
MDIRAVLAVAKRAMIAMRLAAPGPSVFDMMSTKGAFETDNCCHPGTDTTERATGMISGKLARAEK